MPFDVAGRILCGGEGLSGILLMERMTGWWEVLNVGLFLSNLDLNNKNIFKKTQQLYETKEDLCTGIYWSDKDMRLWNPELHSFQIPSIMHLLYFSQSMSQIWLGDLSLNVCMATFF